MRKYFLFYFAALLMSLVNGQSEAKEKLAVVGGGGSGLTTAWLVEGDYDVTLFEKQNKLGGHANTIEITVNGDTFPIDAGFEFLNGPLYPYFNRLLNLLNVPLHQFPISSTFYRTDGSDIVVMPPISDGKIVWESLFPSDIFELIQFEHTLEEAKYLVQVEDKSITFQQFVDSLTLTDGFKDHFLYPFCAGEWGVTTDDIKNFGALDVLKYMVINHPKGLSPAYWTEIVGGTITYINTISGQLANTQIKLNSDITSITYDQNGYTITESDGTVSQFDHLVLATNAFQAKELLKDISETSDVRTLLGQIRYIHSTLAVHGDKRFMPSEEKDWSVANIRYDGVHSEMTFYKSWRPEQVFRSWLTFDVRAPNDNGGPMPDPLYALVRYWHPIVDLPYFVTQNAIQAINGNRKLWFAGIYTAGIDAHESAIRSAIQIANKLAPDSERLQNLNNLN